MKGRKILEGKEIKKEQKDKKNCRKKNEQNGYRRKREEKDKEKERERERERES